MQCTLAAFRLGSCRHFACIAVAGIIAPLMSADAATLRFMTDAGALVVQVDDPEVKVSLDGQELRITGAGLDEIRLSAHPRMFQPGAPSELLAVTKNDRVVVQVKTLSRQVRPADDAREDLRNVRVALRGEANRIAGELVRIRNELDARVWSDVSQRWTKTEAAKLLIAFFRGDGTLPGFRGTADEARELQAGLARLRKARERAMAIMGKVALLDSREPRSPLVGAWDVTAVKGAGGMAADALELYDPDPVGRKFIVANESAGLMTGAGFWLFDAKFDGPDGVDLSAVVRGGTVYRGRFKVEGNEATIRIAPMNEPRPDEPGGQPTDGGFVLELRRASR